MSPQQKKNASLSNFSKKTIALKILTTTLIILGMQTACVTVNVNFPESAVQKATDDYVRDLYRTKEAKGAPSPTPSGTPSAQSSPKGFNFSVAFASVAYASEARADDEVFKVDTDKALAIRDKLSSRLADVIQFKRSGVLGESNDGMLFLKEGKKLKPLLFKKAEKLVSDENADREALYSEIVSANGMNKNRLKNVQKSFARSFQAESPSHTWVQDAEGKWAQKP